ncbi:MAG: hypothetical protein H0U23_09710 [Blastocatellia bacterium]|nr:hypothetical protein [Blastocatellia bacterium]
MSDFCPSDSQRARLREWLRRIEDERGQICVEGEDYRITPDPDVLTDWLWVESSLTQPTLEEKIRGFTESPHREKLTAAEHFHLIKRFDIARQFIEAILSGRGQEQLKLIQRWPSTFDDQFEMNSWLFIEVWNLFGESYLAAWADWFLQETFLDEETQTWHWKTPPLDC